MKIEVVFEDRTMRYPASEMAKKFNLFSDLIREFPDNKKITYTCTEHEYNLIKSIIEEDSIIVTDQNLPGILTAAEKLGCKDMMHEIYEAADYQLSAQRHVFLGILLDFYGGFDRFPSDLLFFIDDVLTSLIETDTENMFAIIDKYSLGKSAKFTKYIQQYVMNSQAWHMTKFIYMYLSVIWKDSIGSLADIILPGEEKNIRKSDKLQIIQYILEHGDGSQREKEMMLSLC